MVQDKRQIAAQTWKHATGAMAKEEWDYAIEMFTQCVTLVPDNLMYRQALRGVEFKKYNNNKSGARFASLKLKGTKTKLALAKQRSQWETVDQEAERGLQVNPWEASLHADIGQACQERGFVEVAAFCYEKAAEFEPTSTAYLRSLAALYEERGDYDKAQGVWSRVGKLDPNDHEARRKATSLAAEKMVDRSYKDKGSTQEVLAGSGGNAYDFDRKSAGPQKDAVAPGQSPELDLQHAIRKDPENRDLYMKLAELLQKENRLEEAMTQMTKAVELSGGDINLREQLEDLELLRMRQNADTAADQSRAAAENEKLKAQAVALKGEFYKRELAVFSSRAERYPKNLRLKFELAQRLMKFKKWDQAIPLLQQSTADTRLEPEARTLLGECFLNDGKKPLATRQFEMALPLVNQHDQPDLYLKCHYVLGRLAEEKGDADAANNHYGEVLSLDYNYRDARARLEKMQGG